MKLRLCAFVLLTASSMARSAIQQYWITDLGSLGGDSSAFSINSTGDVTGWSVKSGKKHAFRYTSSTGIVDLGGVASGDISQGWGINDSRIVVGDANATSGGVQQAFFRSASSSTNTSLSSKTVTGTASTVLSINNIGVIVGAATLTAGNNHAFYGSVAVTPPSL
jgi:probable HAF family extracellular repeat protein